MKDIRIYKNESSECPSFDELVRYLKPNDLRLHDEFYFHELGQHIEQCEICQDIISGLKKSHWMGGDLSADEILSKMSEEDDEYLATLILPEDHNDTASQIADDLDLAEPIEKGIRIALEAPLEDEGEQEDCKQITMDNVKRSGFEFSAILKRSHGYMGRYAAIINIIVIIGFIGMKSTNTTNDLFLSEIKPINLKRNSPLKSIYKITSKPNGETVNLSNIKRVDSPNDANVQEDLLAVNSEEELMKPLELKGISSIEDDHSKVDFSVIRTISDSWVTSEDLEEHGITGIFLGSVGKYACSGNQTSHKISRYQLINKLKKCNDNEVELLTPKGMLLVEDNYEMRLAFAKSENLEEYHQQLDTVQFIKPMMSNGCLYTFTFYEEGKTDHFFGSLMRIKLSLPKPATTNGAIGRDSLFLKKETETLEIVLAF